jgi:hypothetical protein
VWYSVKKHWVMEAQRVVRARRELPPPAGGRGRGIPVAMSRHIAKDYA